MDIVLPPVWYQQFSLGTILKFLTISILFVVAALFRQKHKAIFEKSEKEQDFTNEDERRLDHALLSRNESIIILYGSQTGTAEDYARRLARNLYDDYSVLATVASIEDFDASSLKGVAGTSSMTGRRTLVCFVLATYGEGEPTDNTVCFYEDLAAMETKNEKDELALKGLHYMAFGLGNRSYEKFNFMVRSFDEHLLRLGGTRFGTRGEGDDGTGTLDEDFLAWKEATLPAVASHIGAKKSRSHFESPYEIVEQPDMAIGGSHIPPGERNSAQQGDSSITVGLFDSKNPYMAPIVHSGQLFAPNCGRECLHLQFDISGTNLSYETGDHLGVLPINPDKEVLRLLAVLGLSVKRDTVIEILKKKDSTAQAIIPGPMTYFAILQQKLNICGRVSREICDALSEMAPNAEVHAKMARLAADRELFNSTVTSRCLNLGQFLEIVSGGTPWTSIPFSFLLTCLAPLQPRYYSISSSNRASPTTIDIAAAVKNELLGETNPGRFLGLATNYLRTLTLENIVDRETFYTRALLPSPNLPVRAAVHVRRSTFRLPPSPQTPIIMIGPGTGVAPFRAFMQERLFTKNHGQQLGLSILFTGCRKSTEDHIFAEEWEALKSSLGNDFQVHTAFSRESAEKVYVQHRMMEVGKRLFDLIHNKKAWVYICGDAGYMAKDVHAALVDIVAGGENIPAKDAAKYIAALKDDGRMHVSNPVKIAFSGNHDYSLANCTGISRNMYGRWKTSNVAL